MKNFFYGICQLQLMRLVFPLFCITTLFFISCSNKHPGESNLFKEGMVVTEQTKNPLSGQVAVSAGKSLYAIHCTMCHGETGKGEGTAGGLIAATPTDLTTNQAALPDGKLFLVIKNGIRKEGKQTMPPARKISDQEIWQIVSYVRTLPK